MSTRRNGKKFTVALAVALLAVIGVIAALVGFSTSPPTPRGHFATNTTAAWDSATHEVVAFRGATTWALVGSHWQQLHPKAQPPARATALMAYDGSTGDLVLTGGWAGKVALDTTWAWTGTTWKRLQAHTKVARSTRPTISTRPTSIGWDPEARAVVRFNAASTDILENGAWAVDPAWGPMVWGDGSMAWVSGALVMAAPAVPGTQHGRVDLFRLTQRRAAGQVTTDPLPRGGWTLLGSAPRHTTTIGELQGHIAAVVVTRGRVRLEERTHGWKPVGGAVHAPTWQSVVFTPHRVLVVGKKTWAFNGKRWKDLGPTPAPLSA